MPNFLPHAWEMPYEGSLERSVIYRTTCLFGSKRIEWELRLIPGGPPNPSAKDSFLLWIRALTEDQEAGFFAVSADGGTLLRFHADTEPAPLRALLADILSKGRRKLARAFFLNRSGHLRQAGQASVELLLVRPDGLSGWGRNAANNGFWTMDFFGCQASSSAEEFFNRKASQCWEQVQELLRDPHGEAVFAREFAALNNAERTGRVVFDGHSRWPALKERLHDVLLFSPLWDAVPDEEVLLVEVFSPDHLGIWTLDHESVSVPDSLRASVSRLWAVLKPFDPEVEAFLCVRNWKVQAPLGIKITAQRPQSAHERLEAALRWREWLEEHPA